ncbi:hypothetical protein [Algibacter sp.]|uniref:hypothetical protein n=1 Tax=Algibacter sp. TaxID=1872428 RepID=UPI003C77AC0A
MQFKSARLFILTLLLFAAKPALVFGHNPSLSGTTLHQTEDNKWVLQVSASLTSFQSEVHRTYGEDSYTTPEAFNELVVKLLSESITVSFNGAGNFKLKDPKVRLGHETKVAFLIDEVPTTINSLIVENNAFKSIFKNESLLIIARKEGGNQKFTLNNDNDHKVELINNNSKFEIIKAQQKAQTESSLMWVLVGVSLLGMIAFVLKKYKKSNV